MKTLSVVVVFIIILTFSLPGQQNLNQIQRLEAAGNIAEARAALARAVESDPHDANARRQYAKFLERYGDPAARAEYRRLLADLNPTSDSAQAGDLARRLAVLDLLAGDGQAVARDAEVYRTATGKTLSLGSAAKAAEAGDIAVVPGPLRSFARMAAISPDARPDEVLPALARNVVTNGYQASRNNEALEQTEYLKLVHRYLSQAHELEKLAGPDKVIAVPKCDAPNVAELLRVLGFRMRGGCGAEVVLETVNAARAFLTTDSGFPVNRLEEALRTNRPFNYDYHPSPVTVLFGAEYWLGGSKDASGFLETFIGDPALCRLYLGFSKLNQITAGALHDEAGLAHWKAYAHVLDFFGGMFELRDGKAVVPGGARSAAAWGELAGVSPDHGAQFLDKLVSKDDGWLASLYDALARIDGPVKEYLTEPARMKRFYAAVRGRITSPGPARPVFRSNADMMLLTTRLEIDAGGKPHIPGNLEVWRALFTNNPQAKYDGKLTRLAATWKDPDDLMEALFALCRKTVENEPLKIFMALTDIDRGRATPLAAETVDRLARGYRAYGSEYPVFSESRALSDKAILQFLDTAEAINRLHDTALRADVGGTFQALTGLWQILVRQQTIPTGTADGVFQTIAGRFAQVASDRDLFTAGREGVKALLDASGKPADPAAQPQERMLDLLAGATESDDAETRGAVEEQMLRILDAQRLVSLDVLFQLADTLESSHPDKAQINKLASKITEAPLPKTPLTSLERGTLGFGYWSEKHLDIERKLNPRLAAERAAGDPAHLKDVVGQLSPMLRDSLLGLLYAYYAPPGAQVLYTNPVFVRSHDFIGGEGQNHMWRATEPYGTGWPSNGGGRLVGSLSALPYALAQAEQNFLVPAQTQALIWGDLVPQMMLSAKIPRWWNVTPSQVHWVGLHLRYGRELLAEAALEEGLRSKVVAALGVLAAPVRVARFNRLLEEGLVREVADEVTPSELFLLARNMERDPAAAGDPSPSLADMRRLAADDPKEANYAAISRAFGSPKPTLANSYQPELLNLRTFPTLMGYSSRIMAESWESNTLYWVALADELSLRPAQLNVRIPEWTQKLVEHIFASHLEDWPAVLKSLRRVGDDVRERARTGMTAEQKASLGEYSGGK